MCGFCALLKGSTVLQLLPLIKQHIRTYIYIYLYTRVEVPRDQNMLAMSRRLKTVILLQRSANLDILAFIHVVRRRLQASVHKCTSRAKCLFKQLFSLLLP